MPKRRCAGTPLKQRRRRNNPAMAEESSRFSLRRLLSRRNLLVLSAVLVFAAICFVFFQCFSQHQSLQSHEGSPLGAGQGTLQWREWDIAELQLNHTGPRQDPRLYWQGNPALGRSFLYGPKLDNGELRIQHSGIYRLHIQMTLANCSSAENTMPLKASLTVGICNLNTDSISLLRLNFYHSCTVASQRLTHLARGDTLCTNLTLPLLPSQNADETFFGVQLVRT